MLSVLEDVVPFTLATKGEEKMRQQQLSRED